jgi:hypothetical protein
VLEPDGFALINHTKLRTKDRFKARRADLAVGQAVTSGIDTLVGITNLVGSMYDDTLPVTVRATSFSDRVATMSWMAEAAQTRSRSLIHTK